MDSSNNESIKENINKSKNLICIEYPGIVKNVDNMLETLGGIDKISEVFITDKRRLDLKFQPKNLYCKAVYGDKTCCAGLLLKVKIRRPKDESKKLPVITKSVEVVGKIGSVYKFESLCDFQYLPLAKTGESKESEFIYDKLVPSGLVSVDWLFEQDETPYFLPPVTFTRNDSVATNIFKKDVNDGSTDDTIGRTRNRHHKNAVFYVYSTTNKIPLKPHHLALKAAQSKLVPQENFELVKKCYEKRPIWSRIGLEYETKLSMEQLRLIIPAVAFYHTIGPWRVTWNRFGYDPRKNFDSRYYQILDYRIRNDVGVKNYIKIKRTYTTQKPNISQKAKIFPIIRSEQTDPSVKKDEERVLFNPYFDTDLDKMPQSRQLFYQYCDIRVPQIQEMLDRIPTPMSGAVCNEKTGWLPSGFDDQCRDILTEIIKEKFQAYLLKKDHDEEEEDDLDDDEEEDDELSYDEDDDIDETKDETMELGI